MAYTIFFTYGFETDSYNPIPQFGSYGYSDFIYCNYIQKIETDSVANKNLNFFFNPNDFPFLAGEAISGSTGWTAKKIYALVQYVNNDDFLTEDIKPSSDKWRKYDVTDQINGYIINQTLSINNLILTTFIINLNIFDSKPIYDLSYLNYPTDQPIDNNKLCFGEEQIFFGNVNADISAIAYTSDIVITLPLNKFNSTTNKTWDNVSPVLISEVGIYDDLGNLVAIGKFNTPISKDNTISRTIVFGLDF
jgi:hypothetical protein